MKVYRWTPEMHAAMRRGVAEGRNAKAISAEVGVSKAAVYRKAKELGLRLRNQVEEANRRKAELIRLRDAGATKDEIAAAVGVKVKTVEDYLQTLIRAGATHRLIAERKRRRVLSSSAPPTSQIIWTPDMSAALHSACNSGKSMRFAAKRIGVDPSSVRRRAKVEGIVFATDLVTWTPGMDASLQDGVAKQKSARRIGSEIGVSDHAVRRRAKAMGLVFVRRKSTWTASERRMRIEYLRSHGASVGQIAVKLCISKKTVSNWLWKAKVRKPQDARL